VNSAAAITQDADAGYAMDEKEQRHNSVSPLPLA
jgi:hypothetical protein